MKKKVAQEWIIAAALKLPTGLVCIKAPSAQGSGHKELHEAAKDDLDHDALVKMKSGFLTNAGRYVDRYDARRIAYSAGQLSHRVLAGPEGELYSGDWKDYE